jgi:hypothetical protein
MYRVSLAFVQLFSLYVQWFDLAIIEPVIVCFSSDVYSFSGCICISEMFRYQFQHSRMQRRRHHSRYCPASIEARDISFFTTQRLLWSFSMEDDGAGIGCHHKFSAFSVQHAMQTGHIACTIPF